MHIRNLDEATHQELARRAEATGMSLRAYVIDVLHRHTALPSLDEWLDEARATTPLPAEGPDSVTLVHEGRATPDTSAGSYSRSTADSPARPPSRSTVRRDWRSGS